MRRASIAACLVFVLLAWPAHAQLFLPTPTVEGERTLLNATLFVSPPDSEGLCFPLGPGQLTIVTRRLEDAIEQRPTTLRVDGYQDDPGMHLTMAISRQETTTTTRVSGSYHYCWSINVNAPETESMDGAHRGAYVQTIDVRITHRPD